MDKWEYKVVDYVGENEKKIEKWLNELGADGWEVVTMNKYPMIILKRKAN